MCVDEPVAGMYVPRTIASPIEGDASVLLLMISLSDRDVAQLTRPNDTGTCASDRG